jgi:RNA polymerase sigma factor (sigma-70 family)
MDGQEGRPASNGDPRSEEEQMEQLTQAFEDREVRQLLLGEESDLAEAFTQVDAHLRKRFVKGARERLPGLRPEDLADAWQDTLRDLLKAVRAGSFSADRELAPWLWTIFIRRAFDNLRRKERYQGMLERIRARLDGTTVGDVFGTMEEEERSHVLMLIRQAVARLPARQQTVIQAFVDHFPASENKEALRERVSEITGREETRATVMRALGEARRKVGTLLTMRRL